MSFSTLTTQRYSVRRFKDQPVEERHLSLILEAARNAPTAGNRQPQRILVISQPEGLQKIDRCTRCRFGAPVVLLIGYDPGASWVRPFDGTSSGWVDASIVTTQMMLQATELGLGTTWVMHFDPAKVFEEFSPPANFVPVAMLILGYPAADSVPTDRHTLRHPLSKLVAFEHFV
ncbi:MAG: nitroreductase family protein [Puniceicoccales bacterium]|jgi:nitroreductase|nr:nitroreductase family protein [Puniceicoccales bacterium]